MAPVKTIQAMQYLLITAWSSKITLISKAFFPPYISTVNAKKLCYITCLTVREKQKHNNLKRKEVKMVITQCCMSDIQVQRKTWKQSHFNGSFWFSTWFQSKMYNLLCGIYSLDCSAVNRSGSCNCVRTKQILDTVCSIFFLFRRGMEGWHLD